MRYEQNKPFFLIIAASLANVALSYLFGNEGYEAFLSVCIALSLLITWQTILLITTIFRASSAILTKILALPVITLFWLMTFIGAILSIIAPSLNPGTITPHVNWLIVSIGVIPYLLSRFNLQANKITFTKAATNFLVTMFSIIVLLAAGFTFSTQASVYWNIVLVLAIQLQYIMNFIVVDTNYLSRSHNFALKLVGRMRIGGDSFGEYLIILIIGLPFLIPLGMIMVISALKS